MATRTRYSIIRNVHRDEARNVIAQAAQALPGPSPQSSRWSDWQQAIRMREMTAAVYGESLVITDHSFLLASEIGRLVDSPNIELRVQESDHWDLTLFHRGEIVADFSTRVGYFDPDPGTPRPWKQGDAQAFCTIWGVDPERMAPYLIDWDSSPTSRLARTSDQYPVGDWRQVFDFMTAMGIADPLECPEHFSISVPAWESVYSRQPRWRRVLRQMSVWLKGVYPDVPRPTKEEREEQRRLAESVSVVKLDLEKLFEDNER